MNRNAAYAIPGWADSLAGGLPSFETQDCAGGDNGTLNPADRAPNPNFIPRANPVLDSTPADLFQQIQDFAYSGGLDHRRRLCGSPAPSSPRSARSARFPR